MKKILSGILALTLAGALTMPAFAAEGAAITAMNVTTKVGTDPEATVAPESLKENAADEENMLRISPATLLKITLKLEDDSTANRSMTFIANQKLAEGESMSGDKIQFIDEKVTADDGTVTIQFRPRLNQSVGIYNMRANTKGATMFSKFYKTVTDQIQPTLTNASDTRKKQDIVVNINGYTQAWKKENTLYRVVNNELKPIPEDYTIIEPTESTPNIATLKIKTTSEWATQATHTFRFVSTNVAYNPITFTAKITEPEKVTSNITSEFVSEGTIPEGLGGTITVPDTATEGNPVEFTVTPPKGYNLTGVTYTPEGGESQTITEAEDKYSFTMPAKAVKITANITPITYTLKLDLQGGEGFTEDEKTITGTVEDLIEFPTKQPTNAGFTFANWRTQPNGEGSVVKDTYFNTVERLLDTFKDKTEMTIYARWIENGKFTVVYMPNGTNVTNKPEDNTSYDQVTTEQIAIPAQEPERAGYNFMGWKVNGDDTLYKYGTEHDAYKNISAIQGSVTFYAQWEPVRYTITLQDGDESSEISGTIEDLPPALPTPTKDGYDFKGWFTAETGGEKIDAITADNISGLTTLYARWEEIQTDDYELVSADQTNNKVKVIKRTDESAYIIVATYTENGNLVKATIKDISDVNTTASGEEIEVAGAFDGEYAKVKVFMWNSLDKMQPRCPAFPQ